MNNSCTEKTLKIICSKSPEVQLKEFLETKENEVPLIVPGTFDKNCAADFEIPPEAEFAVASSGTTGKPKLYFRTKKSWTDFFESQDRIFGITGNSRIFINGSLAFTGNLNTAIEAVWTGAFLLTSSSMKPSVWKKEIEENNIDVIYLIPDKAIHLAKTGVFKNIKTLILGSQFVNEAQLELLKKAFPSAGIFLYYGTSETSFISYKKMSGTEDSRCMGQVFDGVEVKISDEGTILVKSPGAVCGTEGFYDTKDTGFIKDGKLFLTGRIDDQINIHGEKINKAQISACLLKCFNIEECEITVEENNGRQFITAHIAGKNLPETIPAELFEGISPVFVPAKYVRLEKLPRNESGKICLKKD